MNIVKLKCVDCVSSSVKENLNVKDNVNYKGNVMSKIY